jgi:hypothetical protein
MSLLFYMKIYKIENKTMVVICDEEILGKVFKEGDVVLNISPTFYGGEKVDVDKIIEMVNIADIVVLSGKRIINELAKRGLTIEEYALKVEDQLHIQIIKEVYE